MSTETKQRHKLGATVYSVDVWFDDGDDFMAFGHRESGIEFSTLDAAKEWAVSAVRAAIPDRFAVGSWWGEIRRGTYVEDDFDDDDFGRILDVELVFDDDFRVGVTVDGETVEFEEES